MNPSKHHVTSSYFLGATSSRSATVHPLIEDTQGAISSAPTQSAGASLFQQEELPASSYPCLPQSCADQQDNALYFNQVTCQVERWLLSKKDCVCLCDLEPRRLTSNGAPSLVLCPCKQPFRQCKIVKNAPKTALLAQQSGDSLVLQQVGNASSTYLSLPPLRADRTDNVIYYNPTKCQAERWVLRKLDCVCA